MNEENNMEKEVKELLGTLKEYGRDQRQKKLKKLTALNQLWLLHQLQLYLTGNQKFKNSPLGYLV